MDIDYLAEKIKTRLSENEQWVLYNKLTFKLPNITKPQVKRVLFNYPATIIFWEDGTKTVVKCQDGDVFDREKGFVMAYLKKMLGNDNTFNKEIKKWGVNE